MPVLRFSPGPSRGDLVLVCRHELAAVVIFGVELARQLDLGQGAVPVGQVGQAFGVDASVTSRGGGKFGRFLCLILGFGEHEFVVEEEFGELVAEIGVVRILGKGPAVALDAPQSVRLAAARSSHASLIIAICS